MRAIIISAGRAKRMKNLCQKLPKCLLEVNGKTILQHQIQTLNSCKIDDIVVIKGYKKELINYKNVRYRINDDYLNNNILSSLFYAEPDIKGDILITYGDVLFGSEVVKKLTNSDADIAILVDTSWKERYLNRHSHPISEAEKVVMDGNNRLIEIGKILNNKASANGEFLGMMRLSPKGAQIFKQCYRDVERKYSGKAFQRARTFKDAYLTDMLQELVDCKIVVYCICVEGGCWEIDTPQDYITVKKIFVKNE